MEWAPQRIVSANTAPTANNTREETIVDSRQQTNKTKKHWFPYYLLRIEFMRAQVMKNEKLHWTLGRD
jgi:hypothetical protein